jgi:prefoldin subunit 5
VVTTADTALWVECENVRALKVYAETVKAALDKKTQEAELLRAECERLKVQQAQKQ